MAEAANRGGPEGSFARVNGEADAAVALARQAALILRRLGLPSDHAATTLAAVARAAYAEEASP